MDEQYSDEELLSKKFTKVTRDLHHAAEKSSMIQSYLQGTINCEQHIAYTYQEYRIFKAIENALREIQKDPAIADNSDLLYELMALGHARSLKNTMDQAPSNFPPMLWKETQELLDRISAIKHSFSELLAHVYLQYRGLFNGGNILYGKKLAALKRTAEAKHSKGDVKTDELPRHLKDCYKTLNKNIVAFINADRRIAQNAFLKESVLAFQLAIDMHQHSFIPPAPHLSFWKKAALPAAATAILVGCAAAYIANRRN